MFARLVCERGSDMVKLSCDCPVLLRSRIYRVGLACLVAGCLGFAFVAPSIAEEAKTDKPVVEAAAPPATPAPMPATAPAPAPATAPASAPSDAPAPQPAAPAQPSSPAIHPVTQAAVQSGVLTCVSRINQVMTFLTANGKSSAFLFAPAKQPDLGMFSVSIASDDPSVATRYASASFAPTANGLAAAVYDTVEYVAQSPDAVEKSTFKSLKRKGTLGKDTIMLDGGPVTVFLMPAGSGCIVIRKEVVQ